MGGVGARIFDRILDTPFGSIFFVTCRLAVRSASPPRSRKGLNADALFHTVRSELECVPDWRTGNVGISMADALTAGFALFSLKDPSLLAFEARRIACDPNLHALYLIERVPCDTQLRIICDGVIPDFLRPAFRALFRKLQRGKALEPFVFIDGHYLVSLDGTGFYSSRKVGSAVCLTQTNPKTGEVTYSLQLLGACLVHPEKMEVIPLFPEMITNGDGQLKNDCERNAARRWLEKFRQDHPHLKVIITEDALSPNAPHIRDLQRHNCRFILGVKPGDHHFLFDYVEAAHAHALTTEFEQLDPNDPTITHRYRFLDQVPLNKSNLDVLVTFVEYWEIGPKGTKHFTWVTDLAVTTDTVYQIMRGGRARWRIENETFNTLKNQGYHFGHNYGLGKQNLAAVFTTLMMLAFLVDQIQQLCCPLFRAVWAKLRSKRALWEALRSIFGDFLFDSMIGLYRALWCGIKKKPPELLDSS
jgi:hypothetical protein